MQINNASRKAFLLICVIFIVAFFGLSRWTKTKVVEADVISYYSYLPAVFVYGDISMYYATGNSFFADKVWGVRWRDGLGPVQKFTMGLSVAYLPFFLMGHAGALLTDYPVDGYSAPYMAMLQFSGLFYLLLGLFFLRKILLRYFSDAITALVILILPLGTNLLYYSLGPSAMPHVFLFCLITLLLYCTIRFYESPSWRFAIFIGLLAGWITLIRPNHLLIWMIPALYGITDKQSFQARLRLLWAEKWKFLSWPLLMLLIVLPQLFYWKYLTLRWVYYSYGDEGFFFSNPQIWRTLLSFRNGWLIYSPLMVLGLLGLFRVRKHAPRLAWVLPLHFLISLYIISSWWCWWYGGSFGNRVFIDLYPLLAISMAATLTWSQQFLRKVLLQRVALGLIGALMCLNFFQSFQAASGLLHYDAMTPAAYRALFAKIKAPANLEELLDHPDYEAAKKGRY